MSTRGLFVLLGVLFALAIAFVSALPTATKHALHTQGVLHPWLHFFGFAVIAFLLVSGTRPLALRLVLIAALLFFGYATEAHEGKADGWPIEINDVHTDMIGVALGSALGFLSKPQRQAAKTRR